MSDLKKNHYLSLALVVILAITFLAMLAGLFFNPRADVSAQSPAMPSPTSQALPTPTDVPDDPILTGAYAQLYECTQLGCSHIDLEPGLPVTILGRSSCTWVEVEVNGLHGFLRAEALSGPIPEFEGCPPPDPQLIPSQDWLHT